MVLIRFYEDGYKLVEVPYPGMEHQSSVTYGNGFRNGYTGRDISSSGWGFKFDFIIIHESGHEWFANNVTNWDEGRYVDSREFYELRPRISLLSISGVKRPARNTSGEAD